MSVDYEDPIILLANDPNLNKDIGKTNELISLISEFSIAERKVSKLCQLSLTILQTLEKIELTLKNWAFISLDINSNDHFNNSSDSIKEFNNNISLKVLTDCNDLNKRLSKISIDLDYITKASRTLSPMEYILDSGTLLTSLTLRNIKLKYELTDKVTVAYLKAKLITIGKELESMLDETNESTIATYKTFVASLLKQLNTAIDEEDAADKQECLAVINDMEKMFDAFKLEKAQEMARKEFEQQQADNSFDSDHLLPPSFDVKSPQSEIQSPKSDIHSPSAFPHNGSEDDNDSLYSEIGSSMYGSSTYNPPLIRSITKSQATVSPVARLSKLSESHTVSDSFSSMGNSILQKTTLADEMPYLMSAFDLAKNVQEDINTFQQEDPDSKPKRKAKSPEAEPVSNKIHFPDHQTNLPQTPLSAQSTILHEQKIPSPYSYLYANNSLLSRLGIKPQVITTDVTPPKRELGLNTTANINNFTHKTIENTNDNEKIDKENNMVTPLTQKNLQNHTFSSLSITNDFNDHVE